MTIPLRKSVLPIRAASVSVESHSTSIGRNLLPQPNPAVAALVEEQLHQRPHPLRVFDQVHMNVEDVARHLHFLGTHAEGKHMVFMGDSDGVALGLATAAQKGLLPAPSGITLCDFDERVLQHVETEARAFGCASILTVRRYNVFSPLPAELRMKFDLFHTNPPYGMYNGGRSIMAFIERCISATKRNGDGVVVLGNDPRREWTMTVLRAVLHYLVERKVTPIQILQRVHRYDIDDDPELESGLIYCHSVFPNSVNSENNRLPLEFVESFYGRETIPIPDFITASGNLIYEPDKA